MVRQFAQMSLQLRQMRRSDPQMSHDSAGGRGAAAAEWPTFGLAGSGGAGAGRRWLDTLQHTACGGSLHAKVGSFL